MHTHAVCIRACFTLHESASCCSVLQFNVVCCSVSRYAQPGGVVLLEERVCLCFRARGQSRNHTHHTPARLLHLWMRMHACGCRLVQLMEPMIDPNYKQKKDAEKSRKSLMLRLGIP